MEYISQNKSVQIRLELRFSKMKAILLIFFPFYPIRYTTYYNGLNNLNNHCDYLKQTV